MKKGTLDLLKTTNFLILAIAALAVSATSGHAATATPSYLGTATTFPGLSTDFTLFGNKASYPDAGFSGGSPADQPTVLDDFSVSVSSSETQWGGDAKYSTIIAPDGNSYATGLLYSSAHTDPALATVTLGNTAGFDYSDFNLYVMFGNGDANRNVNTALTVTIDGTTYSGSVTDEQTTNGNDFVQVEEFNIQGLTAGDTFTVGAVSNGGLAYVGGLSFSPVPEPSTYVLTGLSVLALMGIFGRRKLKV